MGLTARLGVAETLGDRVMKVDHAGEHGAICIYRAQRWFAHWRAPEMVPELEHFLTHERGHRALFGAELQRRNRRRCRSYHWCGVGGFILGGVTGLAGRKAIAATVAIERVVLRHMHEQLFVLENVDEHAAATLRRVIAEEQEHHDLSVGRLGSSWFWSKLIDPLVSASTETTIWLGMNL